MTTPYRDDRKAALVHRDSLPLADAAHLPDVLVQAYGYRLARILGAVAGIAGFTAMLVDIALGCRHLTYVLVLSWGALGAGFTVGALVAGRVLRRGTQHYLAQRGDPFDQIAVVRSGGAARFAAKHIARLERASFTLPLVCMSLLAPLTLHLLIGSLVGTTVRQFDSWIVLSLVLVGHAHLTLVVLSVRHVVQVERELDVGLPVIGGRRGAMALLWTAAAAAVPGAVALFIPPVLVAATGAVFVPWMFHWAARRAQIERAAVAAAVDDAMRLLDGEFPRGGGS